MAGFIRTAVWMVFFFSAGSAFAAGGACPTSADYVNSVSGAAVTLASFGVTSCYYVAANGSDSNTGTTEASPWLHSPGMQNCAGNCAAASITAGVGIIFRGGDTWHFGNSTLSPYAGVVTGCDFNRAASAGLCFGNAALTGTSSHPVYIGVDPTWYSGSSWVRPVLTGDNPLTPHPGVFQDSVTSCTYQLGSNNKLVSFESSTYIIFDGFELTGLCSNANNSGSDIYVEEAGPTTSNNTYERLYVHGWTHIPFSGSYLDNITLFSGNNNNGLGDSHVMNVVDGSDSDPGGIEFVTYAGAYNYAYNVFRYAANFVVTSTHVLHDNLFEHWYGEGDEQHHPNLYEENGEASLTNAIYNNVFRNVCDGNNCPVGSVGIWLFPTAGFTTYFFNNLVYDVNLSGNYFNLGQNANGGNQGTLQIFNNTWEDPANGVIVNCNSTFSHPFTAANNHYITDNSSQYSSPCTGGTYFTELLQTHAVADADVSPAFNQYSDSQTPYALAPVASTNSTVGTGTNEESFCTSLTGSSDPLLQAAGTACESDTTYAMVYNSTSHTITFPARPSNARPSSGAWDIGAYQYSSSQASAPNAPTNLIATIQ